MRTTVTIDDALLDKAAQLIESLAIAAKEARAAVEGLGAAMRAFGPPADDIVTCTLSELQPDGTPALILAELRALRQDLAQQLELVTAAARPLHSA